MADMMTEADKTKFDGAASKIHDIWEAAKKKNKSDPNTKEVEKFYFGGLKLSDGLKPKTTTLDDFDEAMKKLTKLSVLATSAASKVKAEAKEEKTKEPEKPAGVIKYVPTSVEKLCKDGKTKTKIQSVFDSGPKHNGGTSTPSLKAYHTHVTDKDAIAYKWVGDDLHVVAYGEKSGQAGKGDGGYKWETK